MVLRRAASKQHRSRFWRWASTLSMLHDRELHTFWLRSVGTAVGRRFSVIQRGAGRQHSPYARLMQPENSPLLVKRPSAGSMLNAVERDAGCGGGNSKPSTARFTSILTNMAGHGAVERQVG